MLFARSMGLAGSILVCVLAAVPLQAGAFELSGAWSTQADMCDHVFKKSGDQLTFAELSDLYGSGFIVNGNRLVGKAARCTIETTKQASDSLELAAACATSIMTQNVKFSLKIIDENTIDRMISEIPGMIVRYARCKI